MKKLLAVSLSNPLLIFTLLFAVLACRGRPAWAQAPAFRASTTAGNGAGTSVVVTKPTGTVQDDILINLLYLENTADTITAPSGWTELTACGGNQTGPTPDFRVKVYWLRAGASEPTSYTWSWTNSVWRTATMAAFSGAITTGDPTDGCSFNASATSSTSMTATGITTTVADTLVIFLGTEFDGSPTATPPSGMTERVDFANVYLADVAQASAGATGNKTATLSAAAWNTGSLTALKPPGGGGPAPQPRRLTLLGVG